MLSREKNAIEYLNECVNKENLFEEELTLQNIGILLNYVDKLQKESSKKQMIIKGKDCVIETQAHNEEVLMQYITYKDKQIDLMSEQLTTPIHSKTWVKQYYEKLAREK